MNLTLIGMPGAGKSFVGKALADELGYAFVDPDKLLESMHGKPLADVLAALGEEAFLRAEADLSVAALEDADGVVLSTGGSIVYSTGAMERLSELSSIVYLHVDIETLADRIGNVPRGIVGSKDRTLEEIFRQREPMYEAWAALTVDGTLSPERIIADIRSAMNLKKMPST